MRVVGVAVVLVKFKAMAATIVNNATTATTTPTNTPHPQPRPCAHATKKHSHRSDGHPALELAGRLLVAALNLDA